MSAAAVTNRILDPLGVLVRRLTRLAGIADEETPLTATQRVALIELYDSGPLRLNALAHLVGTSAATASRAVDALVQLGLVVRLTDPRDRRAVQIDLSPQGRRSVDARKARAAVALAPAVAALDRAEQRELVRLLELMTEALEVSRSDASVPTRSPVQPRG